MSAGNTRRPRWLQRWPLPVQTVPIDESADTLLFTPEELPEGFTYPRGLLRLVELQLFELEPCHGGS